MAAVHETLTVKIEEKGHEQRSAFSSQLSVSEFS
jgi:hypothetical protein